MSRLVIPFSPCQNCETLAKCVEVNPPPQLHSGWECTNCGESRWGGVLSVATARCVGYSFSNGCVLCWRCHRQHCDTSTPTNASNYPKLDYLSGFMLTLWGGDEEARDKHCDECGNLVDNQ